MRLPRIGVRVGASFSVKVGTGAAGNVRLRSSMSDNFDFLLVLQVSLESGSLAEESFFLKIPSPATFQVWQLDHLASYSSQKPKIPMQVSVSGEVNLFRLSREAYQKAAAMYPHEADKVVKILADRLREEAEKNAKQSYFSPSALSARDISVLSCVRQLLFVEVGC